MKKQFIKPPFLSTSFSQNGKNVKKRFENILNTNVKRAGAMLAAAVLAGAVCVGALVACDEERNAVPETGGGQGGENPVSLTMDEAVSSAILADSTHYADAEFYAEGHIILGRDGKVNADSGETEEVKVYAVTSIGGYTFMNGMFIKDSGSGAIPAVIILKPYGGGYEVLDIQYPKDGSMYADSIREMFPEAYHSQLLGGNDYYDELKKQEQAQAKEYMDSIGRTAEVGEYADLGAVLPDMNVGASNKTLELGKYDDDWKYPMFIGNVEYLENGERYIYETAWDGDESGGVLTYTKYDGEGNVIKKTVYDVEGKNVTLVSK
ncbi:MAG: hypothetical protein ACI4SS_00135 [Clostridia bacterium]